MKAIKIIIAGVLLLSNAGVCAADIKVGNNAELNRAINVVKPGDRIIMANGTWKDTAIVFTPNGTAKDSIFLMAETPGKVALTGNSSLEIGGKYLVVNGLWFKDGASNKKYVVNFSSNKTVSNNSRLTNCAITNYNPEVKSASSHWINLWGKNNRVDHCAIYGKTNEGTTLVVWMDGTENQENNHRIDHNYFGEHVPLGSNGGETMRIGTSTYSMFKSGTVVEFNTFEKCNGEVEIISSKSCGNIFRNNVFLESQGSLVLRHGNDCVVENNVFFGNNQPYTGGVRIINEGHTVRNNYFGDLTGMDFRGSLVLMNGVPNGPVNRYNQVKNAKVLSNIYYNCGPFQLGAGSDSERTLPPITSTIEGNIIYSDKEAIVTFYDNMNGVTIKNNIADAANAKATPGFISKKLDWYKEGGLHLPKGQNINAATFAPALTAKKGVSWNTKSTQQEAVASETFTVQPGRGTLEAAVKKAKGKAKFVLAPGKYELERPIVTRFDITIEAEDAKNKPVIAVASGLEKAPGYAFKIDSGSRLTVNNVVLSGKDNTAAKYAFSSPSEDTPGSYSLYINNSTITDFNNTDGGAVFRATKGTLADTIKVSNSILKNCFRGFNLSYEKDDKGKYNAENVIFENTVFINFTQWALNYYRGGNDESTIGGNLQINHCVFSKIGTKDKDLVLLNKGIVNVKIENSVFYDNPSLINPVRLDGKSNSITNTLVYNSGEVKLTSKAISANIIDKNPSYTDASAFTPKEKSPLKNAGTDGKDIGVLQGKP
jgi:poly(beta-D-mannuronate) lyase